MEEINSITNIELNNNLLQNNSISSNNLQQEQKSFIETTLGKTINTGLDIGLRILLPDMIENQVIDIKNAIFENGFRGGRQKAIESAMELGKSALGIFTGKFENVSQIQTAVSKGGIIDSVSNVLDMALSQAANNDLIPRDITTVIRKGKDVLLDNISNNIQNTLYEQVKGAEKIENYLYNWSDYYSRRNFDGMEREYTKIKEQLKILVPLEETIKKAREIENLHKLIKNNGQNFSISQNEIELSKKLV